jgi:hypothetical protein
MTTVRVVNFRITPYADDIAAYINSLTEQNIYSIFDTEKRPDVLTAALFAIYKLESNLHNILTKGYPSIENISSSWLLTQIQNQCSISLQNRSQQNLPLSLSILESLSYVYLRDQLLFQDNINEMIIYPNVFVMIIDHMYAGHVYAWTVERVTNIIGIRSSIHQLMINNCGLKQSNIGPIFLNAIHAWAVSNINDEHKDVNLRDHYLRVIQPSGRLPEILEQCGFISTKKIRNNRETAWLFDNGTIGSTSLINGLLFRERDYIIGISSPLRCLPPSYEYIQVI